MTCLNLWVKQTCMLSTLFPLLFIPHINKGLSQFTEGWNHHPIWTAHNKSPHQLFTAGTLFLQTQGWLLYNNDVEDTYGVDEDGPIPELSNDGVAIPEIPLHLSSETFTRL